MKSSKGIVKKIILFYTVVCLILVVPSSNVSAAEYPPNTPARSEMLLPNAEGDLIELDWFAFGGCGVCAGNAHYGCVSCLSAFTNEQVMNGTAAWSTDIYNFNNTEINCGIRNITFFSCFDGNPPVVSSMRYTYLTNGQMYNSSNIDTTAARKYINYTVAINPSTGMPWTMTEMSNIQAGISISHNGAGFTVCNLIYLTINYGYLNGTNPTNKSTNQDLCPYVCVNLSNILGHEMNLTWYWWNGSAWRYFGHNYTVSNGTYCESFSNATDCLTTYHWMVSVNDSTGHTENYSYYFTTGGPSPPTGLTASRNSSTSINLTWSNWTIPAHFTGTTSTMIRYSISGYPANINAGTLATNDTLNETYIVEGLAEDSCYYFSAWTYYSDCGGCWSAGYDTATACTGGGTYNITLYWDCNLTKINPVDFPQFDNSELWAELYTGEVIYHNNSFVGMNPFEVELNQTPDIWIIDYGGLGMYRSIISTQNNNLSFYICCRDEYNGSNLNESQVWYTFTFKDDFADSRFIVSPESQFYIYKYNGSSLYYIHQAYFSAEDTVRVCLNYNDRYFCGVRCPTTYIPFLQYFDTGTDQELEIEITTDVNATGFIHEYCDLNTSWSPGGTGIWINYTDLSYGTDNVTVRIYAIYPNNNTKNQMYIYTFTTSTYNFNWTLGLGCINNMSYLITAEINHSLFASNNTLSAFVYYIRPGPYSPDWIDSIIDEVLGRSPFYPVSWTQTIVFGVCFFILLSFAQINAEVGLTLTGFILIFIEAGFLSHSNITFHAIAVGLLMAISGIIFTFRGRNR